MRVSLEQAIAELKKGEVVAIPTETVYGLAADATNDAALKKIFATKQRPADHPLIVHISDISQVADWVTDFPQLAAKLARAYWPGALTLVLPAKPQVSKVVRGDEPTVALRVPKHPLALALLKQSGLSVAAPSANLFTQLSPTTAAHVEAGLGAGGGRRFLSYPGGRHDDDISGPFARAALGALGADGRLPLRFHGEAGQPVADRGDKEGAADGLPDKAPRAEASPGHENTDPAGDELPGQPDSRQRLELHRALQQCLLHQRDR